MSFRPSVPALLVAQAPNCQHASMKARRCGCSRKLRRAPHRSQSARLAGLRIPEATKTEHWLSGSLDSRPLNIYTRTVHSPTIACASCCIVESPVMPIVWPSSTRQNSSRSNGRRSHCCGFHDHMNQPGTAAAVGVWFSLLSKNRLCRSSQCGSQPSPPAVYGHTKVARLCWLCVHLPTAYWSPTHLRVC